MPDAKLESSTSPKWKTVNLGDVVDFQGGGTPSKKNKSYWNGDIPWASVKDVKGDYLENTESKITEKGVKNSSTKICDIDDLVLVTRISPGKSIISKIKAAINQDLKIVKPKTEISKKYLHYFFKSEIKEIEKKSSGTTVLGINLTELRGIQLNLPPLSTQHRIVEKIEELFSDLDNGIENLKKAKQQLETYKQSVLKAAFEGKLTKEWREQQIELTSPQDLLKDIEEGRKKHRAKKLKAWEKEVEEWKEEGKPGRKPTKPRKSKITAPFSKDDIQEFTDLPESWQWVKFDKINFVETNLVDPANYQSHPHIAPNYIEKMTGRLLDYNTIEDDGVKSKKHLFFEGQIIYSKIRPYLSKLIIAPFDGLCSADMYPIETVLNTKYIYYYMLSDTFLNQASSAGSRSVLPKINQKELGIVAFPVCSHKEQEQIVEILESYLSVIDNTLSSVNSELQKTEALRQSILKKAFEGKLIKE